MVSTPITNLNSYANLDEASAYLLDSVRGQTWEDLDPDSQARALLSATRLLDRQRWEGTSSGLSVVSSVTVAAGGTGYVVGEILTLDSGTTEDPARAKVTTVSAGVVTAVQLLDAGGYTVDPDATSATTASGVGTGCTLATTVSSQLLQLPHSGMTDRYEAAVSAGVVPPEIVQACMELAYLLTQDPTLEGQGSTAQNLVKKAGAGSAAVEFFSPGAFVPITRFSPEIMELIKPFLAGSGDIVAQIGASFSSGTDAESQFDDCDGSGFTEGLG